MGHHFISYSSADGLDFALKLTDALEAWHTPFKVWLDKHKLEGGDDWDSQIVEAIKTCDSLLFILTPDSVEDESICKQEWSSALKFKKPIIPLKLHPDAELPFRLGNRQYIDFIRDFDHGFARLRTRLQNLASPVGQLQALKDRLADAKRDLRRASPAQQPRIEAEIEQLQQQIAEQQRIVDDPQQAENRTEQSIKRGIERERFPEKPATGVNRAKFINPPPVVAPNYFQDRMVETDVVGQFLADESIRMITMAGRSGVGKTTLICRLLKRLEHVMLPDDHKLAVDGIVYLSANGARRVNLPNIFTDLSQFLPQATAADLDALYKNAQVSTKAKMQRLLEHFPSGRYVVLLDNFEDVINVETQSITDAELAEALLALLEAPHHGVKVIITTRILPQTLLLTQPGRQGRVDLDEGLQSPYAENILREMDAGGKIGLRDHDPGLLDTARERTRGYPKALEALFAILAADRSTTLQELLTDSSQKLPENVIWDLVGEAFSCLDLLAQQVMSALAIYGRPVTNTAIDYLLQPYVPGIDSAHVLRRLANMHFAIKGAGRFSLHALDREYVLSQIPQGTSTDRNSSDIPRWSQVSLLDRAGNYFQHIRKPCEQWKTLDDLAPQLAEFELRCIGGDYDKAVGILNEIGSNYLRLWGYYQTLKELYEQLQGKLTDPRQRRRNGSNLGNIYYCLGDYRSAIDYHQQVLIDAQEYKDRESEGAALSSLGTAYHGLGDYQRAIDYHQQSLLIEKEINNPHGEATSLGCLGNAYYSLGDYRRAIDYYEQYLTKSQQVGYRHDEGIALGNLGVVYQSLGDYQRAINYHQQRLKIARDKGYRYGEGIALGNIADVLCEQSQFIDAIPYAHESAVIADTINSPFIGSHAHGYLARTYLYARNVAMARTTIDTALQYDEPQNNHNVLALRGVIALRQSDQLAAQEVFIKAIDAANSLIALAAQNVEALESKALALSGLALIEGPQHISEAIEAYQAARNVTEAAGVVARAVRLLDALRVADEQGILKDVRAAAAGEA